MFEQPSVEIPAAVLAGFLSFISPCVLPLIPGYLSFISGVSIEDLSGGGKGKPHLWKVFINTVFFVIGFSIVFVILGAGATQIGNLLRGNLVIFNRVAGVIVFVFGLHVAGVFKISFLNYEKRFHSRQKTMGVVGSMLVGIAFAFGWTPCIGPILGAILTLAAQQGSVNQGIVLLLFYSAGLGIPFILTALLFNYLIGAFGFIKRHFRAVEIISGSLLMLVGILIFFNLLQVISTFLLEKIPALQNVG
ncbi:MAG: cytochrome c biogenesis protein CcdA [Candidatus Zixiibacteriota bacterium]|nr:MAG: cytochrome c biogenesis protein CcdA [candidate division Zixibacteria bacterium]